MERIVALALERGRVIEHAAQEVPIELLCLEQVVHRDAVYT